LTVCPELFLAKLDKLTSKI